MPDTIPTQPAATVWQPDRAPVLPTWPVPTLWPALWRGARGLCPACGQTHAFAGYLKVKPVCAVCTAPLGAVRADDAPPYFTIFLVGHLLAPMIFFVDKAFYPALWVQAAIWLPASLVMTLVLLRPVKGATLGLMLKLNMVKTDDA